jgi:hypothetical protein
VSRSSADEAWAAADRSDPGTRTAARRAAVQPPAGGHRNAECNLEWSWPFRSGPLTASVNDRRAASSGRNRLRRCGRRHRATRP